MFQMIISLAVFLGIAWLVIPVLFSIALAFMPFIIAAIVIFVVLAAIMASANKKD